MLAVNIFHKKKIVKFQILSLFLVSNLIFSQDYVINDTLNIKEGTYLFTHISFGQSNLTKYYKVMLTSSVDYEKVKKEIINCANKNILEYSEFYLLRIPNNKWKKKCSNKKILTHLMRKIDSRRMTLNLSTSLINFKYILENNKFEYFTNQKYKNIKDLKNVKLGIKPEDVCYFLRN